MAKKTPASGVVASQESSAGAPANLAMGRPSDEELDQRDREKAKPRRAAGPRLSDARPLSRDEPPHEPPPSTEPRSESHDTGLPDEGGTEGVTSVTGDAGRPVDHVGPKPSDDELDRRDRSKSGPRRAAGPPLVDEADRDSREVTFEEPPPETDPNE
jgi:hypothetical protein